MTYFLTVDNLSLLQVFKALISKYGQVAQYLPIWITKMLVINCMYLRILFSVHCAVPRCSAVVYGSINYTHSHA